jgi:hypothetical protein
MTAQPMDSYREHHYLGSILAFHEYDVSNCMADLLNRVAKLSAL